MTTVAIIAEYNPFHMGHAYQIKKIREEFGEDTAIIAVMSGNFTQRGELAITDKRTRAVSAALGGVNLVLELPFPYSMSGADYFARSAVKIIDSLEFVDYLSFGSECGDSSIILKAAKTMLSPEYKNAFMGIKDKSLGYAKKCELALTAVLGEGGIEFLPNNILAIEYVKALLTLNSKIKPHSIKREGSDYLDKSLNTKSFPSAMAIRERLKNGINDDDLIALFPKTTSQVMLKAFKDGAMPTSDSILDSAVISFFRLNPILQHDILDAKDGLYNRLSENAKEANNISTLLKLSETKKYTNAKIRRTMWYSFFGVTSSDMNMLPQYTQILALDTVGMSLLHSFGKVFKIPVLTKPSNTEHLSNNALRAKSLSDRADSVFELTKPIPATGNSSLTMTPFIKK